MIAQRFFVDLSKLCDTIKKDNFLKDNDMKVKSNSVFNKEKLMSIKAPLIDWFNENGRHLPWREDTNPYRVWVSEIMLQQTRISAAISYYERFMEKLPTVADLANIDDDVLMKLWQGLGYYSRARNLKAAAQKVMKDYEGVFPTTFSELILLPGIGRYTAGAIASICGGEAVSAVDGNVMRVLCRYFNLDIDVLDVKNKKAAELVLNEIIPKENPGVFNEAIMELGETVCLPNGEPNCKKCPLFEKCLANQMGTAENIPTRKKMAKRKKEKRIILLLKKEDKIALLKRQNKGLLANLWEFPNCLDDSKSIDEILENMEIGFDSIKPLGEAKHIFSHIEWYMTGYLINVKNRMSGFTWATKDELRNVYSIPSAFCYFFKQILDILDEN